MRKNYDKLIEDNDITEIRRALKHFNRKAMVKELEKAFAGFIETKYAIAVGSGRSALVISLLSAGLKPKDIVIVPDYTCEIVPFTVLSCNLRPHFVDVDKRTFNITADAIRSNLNKKVRAIICCDTYGHPVNIRPILEMVENKDILVIEDVAQACGAEYSKEKAGSIADISIFSLRKTMVNHLGGILTTNDVRIAKRAIRIRKTLEKQKRNSLTRLIHLLIGVLSSSRIPNPSLKKLLVANFKLEEVLILMICSLSQVKEFREEKSTYNFSVPSKETLQKIKMEWERKSLKYSELCDLLMKFDGNYYTFFDYYNSSIDKIDAVIAIEQLKKLDEIVKKRNSIAVSYTKYLKNFKSITLPLIEKNVQHAFLRFPILIDQDSPKFISKRIIRRLTSLGVPISYFYVPLHCSPLFKQLFNSKEATLGNSEYIAKHILPLPVNPFHSEEQIKHITTIVKNEIIKELSG